MNVTITSGAASKIREILAEPDSANALGLRIYVQGGGCSGYQYGFSLETETAEDDATIEVEGVKFFIDYMSGTFLEGSTIDYATENFSSAFTITNPNAKSTCGCGSSFSA